MAERTLYSIAYEMRGADGEWKAAISHVHAYDQAAATRQFMTSLTPAELTRVHVVAVGQTIGYHVEDEKGLILRA